MNPTSVRIRPGRRLLSLIVVASLVVLTSANAAAASAVPAGTRAGGPINTWVPTGPMSLARAGATATLLPDGRVLIAGGSTAQASLYNPARGTFSKTAHMSVARTDATATLLQDGDVLVAGGARGNTQLKSAEIYDPSRATWTVTGSMHVARSGQTATLLPDGDVLVAGGGCNGREYGCDAGSFLVSLKSAEIYDPATGMWSTTASMRDGRQFFTATLLADGKVLVAGGFNSCDDDFCSDLTTAELYDPASGLWSPTGSLRGPREQHTATLLPNGQVLVAGGLDEGGSGNGHASADAELYDPSTGTWTPTDPMPAPHYGDTATLLPNGWVLVAGGQSAEAEIYQPDSGLWVSTASMSTPRTDQTATLLPNGRVLVTGGTGPDGAPQATAELYRTGSGPLVTIGPATVALGATQVGTTTPAQSFTVTNSGNATLAVSGVDVSGTNPGDFTARSNCAAPLLPGGTCTVSVRFSPTNIGPRTARIGVVDNAPLSPQAVTATGYGSGPNTWAPTGSMATARQHFTATLLGDGDVLVAGGEDGVYNPLSGAELYHPGTGTFTPTGSLNHARAWATATLLGDGDVLVAGGVGPGPVALSSAELYDPATGTWTPTGAMNDRGLNLSSVLLPNGRVLVEGFVTGVGAEVYDPVTGTWTNTGPVAAPGYFSTATLLAGGRVLAAGGNTTAAALYDPATNDWTSTNAMVAAQQGPTATALPDGEVLVAGGDAPNGAPLSTSELYDPTNGSWTLTNGPMHTPRFGQTATLLTDGIVLVTGGCTFVQCDARKLTAGSEIYDPGSGFWFTAEPMTQARYGFTATLLANGDVLAAGGSNYCCQAFSGAEIYTPTLLFAHPTSGPSGENVTLTGGGFFAHEPVVITWEGAKLATVRTTRRGRFRVEVTVPPATVGTHTIRGTGRTSFASAQCNFQVTASPS